VRVRAIVARRAAPVLLATLLALGGCGGSHEGSTPRALKLRREDLIAVCRALKLAEGPVAIEVSASKLAWPLLVNGLRAATTPAQRAAIAAARRGAAALRMPPALREAQVVSLTGPAAGVAGLFRSYVLLSARGWTMIVAALDEGERGSPASARFARENAALYIESVYDAHFTLAQVGRKVRDGYAELGGAEAFGATLAPTEVSALARAYSEASDRLHPHAAVRLGS
jgi:hypothetical protein